MIYIKINWIYNYTLNYDRKKFIFPINQCELDILNTCEFDNHLNDYVDLKYNAEFCCKLEDNAPKKVTKWSKIYYADFETDVTVNPHKPFLCCLCHKKEEDGKLMGKKFTDYEMPDSGGSTNIAMDLLNYLQHNSLTYFYNLKYEAYFFINEPKWNVQLCSFIIQ